jgi:RNA-directed DNA polymerase
MSIIDELVEHFGISSSDLMKIIETAPARYKVYQIPKRHGGMRTIAQPARDLKSIQRFIVDTKLASLPVHPSATGYILGKNILDNAKPHLEGRVLLKLDFQNFFPSITVQDWSNFVKSNKACKPMRSDLMLYSNILFWGMRSVVPKCLSIGAPSSPILSNILMYDLDANLSATADKLRVTYTRYADDITISGESLEKVRAFERAARKIMRATRSPKLKFNEEKCGVYLRGQRRMVTGLILTPTKQISIGRERKRLISAMLHHVLVNRSSVEEMGRLKGLLGFCLANEPSFVSRMREKYGSAVLDSALRFRVPERLDLSVE